MRRSIVTSLGIRPDYVIEVRKDILEESDGPMLQHGLKDMHKQKLWIPQNKSQWPREEFLSKRYSLFSA